MLDFISRFWNMARNRLLWKGGITKPKLFKANFASCWSYDKEKGVIREVEDWKSKLSESRSSFGLNIRRERGAKTPMRGVEFRLLSTARKALLSRRSSSKGRFSTGLNGLNLSKKTPSRHGARQCQVLSLDGDLWNHTKIH